MKKPYHIHYKQYNILQKLHIPLGFLLDNLTSIKNALGEEKYQKIVSNANRQYVSMVA
ncbi:MAG: hypothetical protein WAM14_02150 [Candidatus Nitrosopolaris sp.]